MRTFTGLIVALTLGLASAATATSITVDTDKKTYHQSDTITVTTTLVVMPGHSSQPQLLLQLFWNDDQIDGNACSRCRGGEAQQSAAKEKSGGGFWEHPFRESPSGFRRAASRSSFERSPRARWVESPPKKHACFRPC